MTIDLDRMRARVRKPLGIVETTDPDLDTAAIDEYLNMSFWEVQDKFPFREKEKTDTFGTMIGQRQYGNPAGSEAMKSFAVIDPVSGKHIPLDWMDSMEHERIANDLTTARGIPQKYLLESGNVVLWPIPDAVYQIVRKRNIILADLAALNKTLVIPQIWIEIVIYGAVWRAYVDFGDIERSTAIKAHQVALINSVTSVAEKEQGDPRLSQARNEQTVQQQLKTINDTLALKLKEIDVATQTGIAKFDSITAQKVKEVDVNLQQQLKELENIMMLGIKTLDIAVQPRLKALDDTQTVEIAKLDAKLAPVLKEIDNDKQFEVMALDNVVQFNCAKLKASLEQGIQQIKDVLTVDLKTLDIVLQPKLRKLDNDQALALKALELDLQPKLKQLDNRLQHIIVAMENLLQLDLKGLDNDFKVALKQLDNVVRHDIKVLDIVIERDLRRLHNEYAKGVIDDFLLFWGTARRDAGLEVRGRSYDQEDEPSASDLDWPTIDVN